MIRPKQRLERSKHLSSTLENELRTLVFDSGKIEEGNRDRLQLIIGNAQTCCQGFYYVGPEGVEFEFHHNKMIPHQPCACFVRGKPDTSFWQLPQELNEYRVRLIEGGEPVQMEPLFAAMAVMKVFLGMELPEELHCPFPKPDHS